MKNSMNTSTTTNGSPPELKTLVVVPWHNQKQRNDFLDAWKIHPRDSRVVFQQDVDKSGCARTKNAGITCALDSGADIVVVLDDDCYPLEPRAEDPLQELIDDHKAALEPQEVQMVVPTMLPTPRGMPYLNRTIKMQTAASIGLWTGYPDLDAMSALVLGPQPEGCQFLVSCVHGVMFPFCGMNYAFYKDQWDCAVHIDVPRFDDIWMGWIWEKVAYDKGKCFNMNGPKVEHVRQSNVWQNLEEETKYMKQNETLWSAVWGAPRGMTAKSLRQQFGFTQ
jgi:hypothetical protein